MKFHTEDSQLWIYPTCEPQCYLAVTSRCMWTHTHIFMSGKELYKLWCKYYELPYKIYLARRPRFVSPRPVEQKVAWELLLLRTKKHHTVWNVILTLIYFWFGLYRAGSANPWHRKRICLARQHIWIPNYIFIWKRKSLEVKSSKQSPPLPVRYMLDRLNSFSFLHL